MTRERLRGVAVVVIQVPERVVVDLPTAAEAGEHLSTGEALLVATPSTQMNRPVALTLLAVANPPQPVASIFAYREGIAARGLSAAITNHPLPIGGSAETCGSVNRERL